MSGNMPSITKLKSVNMLVVAAVFLTVSWLVVSLRVWVRGYMIRSFGADDWLMIATQVRPRVSSALRATIDHIRCFSRLRAQ